MRVFLVYSRAYKHILREENTPILVNYVYLGKKGRIDIPYGFPSVMIDSGGYQLQVKVHAVRETSVRGYSFWLQMDALPNHPEIAGYMNLDVLNIDAVSKPTIKERMDSFKKSAELTLKNQEIMENEFDLHPIPVWHAGEPEEYLQHYCDTHDYVAIGGLASLGTPSKAGILRLLSFVMQKHPDIKFHLFGIGISGLIAFKSLKPYSVDFSTWNVPLRYGHAIIEDDRQFLKEVKLPAEVKQDLRDNRDLGEDYLRETIRKLRVVNEKLETYSDPYQRLLL